MRFEHVGFNVKEPGEMARWWMKHLDLQLIRTHGAPTHAHFLAGDDGKTMVEIYNNPKAPVPNYSSLSALVLHVAFTVDDINETRERLVKGGATRDGDTALNDDGDELALVRDPWGFPLQLVKGKKPLR